MKRWQFLIQSWLPAVAWMVVIFTLSHQPRIGVSDEYWVNFIFFKTLHILVFAGLYLLLVRGFSTYQRSLHPSHLTSALIISFAYACFDEVHQSFIPTREGTLRDIFIDGVGIFVAYWYAKAHTSHMLGLLNHIRVVDTTKHTRQ